MRMETRLELAGDDAKPPATRCYWVVRDRLLAGAYPGNADPAKHRARLEALWGAGIRTFVSLMEEHETNNAGVAFAAYAGTVAEIAARAGARGGEQRAECLRFAIEDVSITTPAVMAAALDAIDRSLDAGRGVYVHCFGGIGRTGMVIGAWMIRRGLATPDDVMAKLAHLRRADEERASRQSPETAAQIAFMKTWSDT